MKKEPGPSMSKPSHSYQTRCTLRKLCLSKAMCTAGICRWTFYYKREQQTVIFLSLSTHVRMCPLKHLPQCMYGRQRTSAEPFPSFHRVGSGDGTRVLSFYQLTHLASPKLISLMTSVPILYILLIIGNMKIIYIWLHASSVEF